MTPRGQSERSRRYFTEFGVFMDNFARMEVMIARFLIFKIGLGPRVGAALLDKATLDRSIGMLRRLYRARDQKIEPALDAALSQLTIISKTRNKLVHWGVTTEPDGSLTAAARQKLAQPDKPGSAAFKLDDFAAMLADLQAIEVILSAVELADRGDLSAQHVATMLPAAASAAWRYKA